MEAEFREIDESGNWNAIYQVGSLATQQLLLDPLLLQGSFSVKTARLGPAISWVNVMPLCVTSSLALRQRADDT